MFRVKGNIEKIPSHLFDLLQCQTSCLRNEEPSENSTKGTSRAPNEEDFDAQVGFVVVDEKRYNDADDGIPEPIASRGECNSFRPDGQREDFSNDNPWE